ncbi:MAG TPA: hypothetical protein VGE24_06980 [Emticicia sp.]
MTLVKETSKKAEKAKNQLRIEYDYAQEHYGGLATIWKKDFITDADYQLFIRIYSYKPLEEIPQKFHTKIAILKSMISHHAELVRKYLSNDTAQLTLPMA